MQTYCAHAAIRKYLLILLILILLPFRSRLFVNIQVKWNISPDSSGAATAPIPLCPRSTSEISTDRQGAAACLYRNTETEQQPSLRLCICYSGDCLAGLPTYSSISFTELAAHHLTSVILQGFFVGKNLLPDWAIYHKTVATNLPWKIPGKSWVISKCPLYTNLWPYPLGREIL